MKRIIVVYALLVGFKASADTCPGTAVSDAASVLRGQTVIASTPTESWHEVHCSASVTSTGGRLFELAAGTPMDPSHYEGNWTAQSSGSSVTYNYDGGSSFTYDLKVNSGNNYCLENASKAIPITFGSVTSCP